MGYQFVSPMAILSRVDGICRIGIQPDSGIAVIALDTTINVALTGIFIRQLLPALGSSLLFNRTQSRSAETRRRSFLSQFTGRSNNLEGSSSRNASQRNLKMMLIRNVVGTTLLLCATIANNVLFLTWPYAVYSHACQLMCLTDSMYLFSIEKCIAHTDKMSSCIGYAGHTLVDHAYNSGCHRGISANSKHFGDGQCNYASTYP